MGNTTWTVAPREARHLPSSLSPVETGISNTLLQVFDLCGGIKSSSAGKVASSSCCAGTFPVLVMRVLELPAWLVCGQAATSGNLGKRGSLGSLPPGVCAVV